MRLFNIKENFVIVVSCKSTLFREMTIQLVETEIKLSNCFN